MGEREKERGRKRENGSCPVDRGRSEEVKVVKGGPRWMAWLPLSDMVMSRSGLLLGLTPRFMAPVCVDTTKGREDRTVESL